MPDPAPVPPDDPRATPSVPAPASVVVVMGVSGSGKTTIARGIAEARGWTFAEGDEFHPPENVAKMARGEPLTDEDRWPWLRRIHEWVLSTQEGGGRAAITCSALRRAYRDVLREGDARVAFCHLTADPALVRARVETRTGHYMPASLVPSQLATLEPLEPDEPGVVVSTEGPPDEVLARVLDALGLGDPGTS